MIAKYALISILSFKIYAHNHTKIKIHGNNNFKITIETENEIDIM